MANVWQKAFNRIFWRNRDKGAPFTPLGESELLPMDASIDEMDDRILNLNTTKADQSDFLTSLKNITYNSATGVFTITKFNDSTFTIDTDLEKIAVNFDYDDDPTSAHYQNLIITLDDGTVKYVDLSALITEYEFGNTATINFTVSSSTGIVTANLINGSVTSDHLAPSVMADINAAVASAEGSAEDSEAWAVGQRDGSDVPSTDPAYQNNSKYYSGIAGDSAEDSEAYAIGKRGGTDVPQSDPAYHNNAKYYAEQAEATLSNTVRSFNGRTGAVVPTAGDYDISKITPTSGAVEGQIPVVVNNGTAQEPEYGFALGYASSSGIGSASLTLLNQRFSVTMNQKFSLVEGAYLAISFPNNDYPGHNKANLTIGNFGNIAVKVDGTVIPDSEEIGREEKILKAGETGLFVYDGTYLNLVDKNGSSGHSILDQNGTSMAQEDSLQFADSFVSDDDVNGKTVVENIKEVDPADYDSTTDEGIIVCDDGEDAVIHPSSEDYVEVTADGVKTIATLLNELYALADLTKINEKSTINLQWSSAGADTFLLSEKTNANAIFTCCYVSSNTSLTSLKIMDSNSTAKTSVDGTIRDASTDVLKKGYKITLYYGNKKAVVDLQTTANRCLLNSGEMVESALTNKCKILNGTVTNDFSGGIITKINFPTSFTKDNSVVISSYISADNGVSWYPIRDGSSSNNYVYVESTGIYIYNGDGSWTGRKYRIALSQF